MKLLLFILTFVAVKKSYQRLFVPRPTVPGEKVRLGFGNWFLVAALTIVSFNVLASSWQALRLAATGPHHGHHQAAEGDDPAVVGLAEEKATIERRLHEIARLARRYEDERDALEGRLAAARRDGLTYEAAVDDPVLSDAFERLARVHRGLEDLESRRERLRARWVEIDRELFRLRHEQELARVLGEEPIEAPPDGLPPDDVDRLSVEEYYRSLDR